MVYFVFSLGPVFMEKFVDQNRCFSNHCLTVPFYGTQKRLYVKKKLGQKKNVGLKNFWVRKILGLHITRSLSLLCLPSKVIFNQRLSCIKGSLPSNVGGGGRSIP